MAKTLSSNTFTIRCFNPTRDLYGYIECRFAQNTLSETTIRNYTPNKVTSIPALSYGSPPPRPTMATQPCPHKGKALGTRLRATYMSAGLEESPIRSSRTRRFSFGVSNFLI